MLLLVASGLYELFLDKVDVVERLEVASRLLPIGSIDDLKDRIARFVLLVLLGECLPLDDATPLDPWQSSDATPAVGRGAVPTAVAGRLSRARLRVPGDVGACGGSMFLPPL